MSADTPTSLDALTFKLCPWLMHAFERLESARTSQRLGHGWLIAGQQGVGKLNLALTLAGRLLAPERTAPLPEPLTAEEAEPLLRIRGAEPDHHPDLHWLMPLDDKRTITIEQVREIQERLALKSLRGGAKVVVIEPAEAMTQAAANALLKTLEEPTDHTWLLLLAHQPGRLPATIRSRCQTITIRSPSPDQVLEWLGGGELAGSALNFAGGSPILALECMGEDYSRIIISIEEDLNLLSTNELDPFEVVERWSTTDAEMVLNWLIRRLQLAIRARSTGEPSNRVTDRSGSVLHNAWAAMTLPGLFGQLRAAERLLSRIGGGVNFELALATLLLGFSPGQRKR
jgi:DNA polymerase III subunit delta'